MIRSDSPNNGIGGEGRSAEDVKEGTSVESGLPVDGRDKGGLVTLVRVEETEELELEACGIDVRSDNA